MIKNKKSQAILSNFILLIIFLVVAIVSGLIAGVVYYEVGVLDNVLHTVNFPLPIENNQSCSPTIHSCNENCNEVSVSCSASCSSISNLCSSNCYSNTLTCRSSCNSLPPLEVDSCYNDCNLAQSPCNNQCDSNTISCNSICNSNNQVCSSNCDSTISSCTSTITNTSLTDFQGIMNMVVYPILGLRTSLPYLVYFMIFGFIIALGITAYLSSKNPVFFVLHILFTAVITYFTILISNAYANLLRNPFINQMMLDFTIYNKVMLYLPQIVFFTALIFGVIGFVNVIKPQSNTSATGINYGGDY